MGQIMEAGEDIHDLQDRIDSNVDDVDNVYKSFNKAIVRKAIECHMPQPYVTRFKEFNIRDMKQCIECNKLNGKGMCRRHAPKEEDVPTLQKKPTSFRF